MHYLSIYLEFIKIRLKSTIEHRSAFLWTALAQATSYSASFAMVWVMVKQFKTIGQWKAYEVMFLSALNLCSYALAGFFFYGLNYGLSRLVQTGEFDEILTKPLNSLMYIASKYFLWGYLTHTALSIIIIGICINKLGVVLTSIKIVFLIITLISSALIQSSIFLFTATPCFWLVKNDIGAVVGNIKNFIQYPITIYQKFIQIFMTVMIPFAFINFYPAQFFLGKNDFSIFHPVFQFLSPIVGVILFLISLKFWSFGINHYKSTGS